MDLGARTMLNAKPYYFYFYSLRTGIVVLWEFFHSTWVYFLQVVWFMSTFVHLTNEDEYFTPVVSTWMEVDSPNNQGIPWKIFMTSTMRCGTLVKTLRLAFMIWHTKYK